MVIAMFNFCAFEVGKDGTVYCSLCFELSPSQRPATWLASEDQQQKNAKDLLALVPPRLPESPRLTADKQQQLASLQVFEDGKRPKRQAAINCSILTNLEGKIADHD